MTFQSTLVLFLDVVVVATLPLVHAVDCSGNRLASVYSAKDDGCVSADAANPSLYLPLGRNAPGDFGCFGWVAQEEGEEEGLNSASNIYCSEDSLTVHYTQFPGNLVCDGTGEDKHFKLDSCEEGTPPSLRDTGLDLSCCTDPDSEACAKLTGTPKVNFMATRIGKYVTKNGETCDEGTIGDEGTTGDEETTVDEGTTGDEETTEDNDGSITTSATHAPKMFVNRFFVGLLLCRLLLF